MNLLNCALGFLTLHQDTAATQLALLSEKRKAFESQVVERSLYRDEEHLYSMPLNQHVPGFYPVGTSDQRYLIYVGNEAKSLLFQSLTKGRAVTRWRISLRPSKKRNVSGGTLARLLDHFRAAPKSKLTKVQRVALNKKQAFAAYERGGPEGQDIAAWFVHVDGTEGKAHRYWSPRTIPIIDDEARALGLGSKGWPPDMKFDVDDH